MCDINTQLMEVEIMKSIYTDEEFTAYENGNGLHCIHFRAFLELPKNFLIIFGDDKEQNEGKEATDQHNVLSVQYLPPIELTAELPTNYPSGSAPEFHLSCEWLPVDMLINLCQRLDEIWDENVNEEILYIWTRFLKVESLAFLKLENSLQVNISCFRPNKPCPRKQEQPLAKSIKENDCNGKTTEIIKLTEAINVSVDNMTANVSQKVNKLTGDEKFERDCVNTGNVDDSNASTCTIKSDKRGEISSCSHQNATTSHPETICNSLKGVYNNGKTNRKQYYTEKVFFNSKHSGFNSNNRKYKKCQFRGYYRNVERSNCDAQSIRHVPNSASSTISSDTNVENFHVNNCPQQSQKYNSNSKSDNNNNSNNNILNEYGDSTRNQNRKRNYNKNKWRDYNYNNNTGRSNTVDRNCYSDKHLTGVDKGTEKNNCSSVRCENVGSDSYSNNLVNEISYLPKNSDNKNIVKNTNSNDVNRYVNDVNKPEMQLSSCSSNYESSVSNETDIDLKSVAGSTIDVKDKIDVMCKSIDDAEDNKVSESKIVCNKSLEPKKDLSDESLNRTGYDLPSIHHDGSFNSINKRIQKCIVQHYFDNFVKFLMEYNETRALCEFRKAYFDCSICFEVKKGIDCVEMKPCCHVFCKDCVSHYLRDKIREGTVYVIKCPENKCVSDITPSQVHDAVDPDEFARYDNLLLTTTLQTMTDITLCPRTACQYPVSREPDEKMATCPACKYVFCVFCRMVYHGVEACRFKNEEKKELVKRYTDGTDEVKQAMEHRYGKKQLLSLVQASLSEAWIGTNSQNCPHCNASIEKNGGCNKMVCWRCSTYFCWICSAQLDPNCPYLHYNDKKSRCYKQLFQGANISDDEDEEGDFILFEDFEEDNEFNFQ